VAADSNNSNRVSATRDAREKINDGRCTAAAIFAPNRKTLVSDNFCFEILLNALMLLRK
jgi:hypothetical protein